MLKYKLTVEVQADGKERWTAWRWRGFSFDKLSMWMAGFEESVRWKPLYCGPTDTDFPDLGARELGIARCLHDAQGIIAGRMKDAAEKIVDRATVCVLQVRPDLHGNAAVTAIHEIHK